MAHPSTPSDRRPAGRSADARGETGTDADTLAPQAGAATGDTRLGGIPSTADSALSPGMSGSSDLSSDGPPDRERPAPDKQEPRKRPAAPQDTRPQPARGQRDDDSPLESLGKAVSAPVRGAADEDAGEKPG